MTKGGGITGERPLPSKGGKKAADDDADKKSVFLFPFSSTISTIISQSVSTQMFSGLS